uniref:Uncharacterized protein n=1 Tax=Tetranychus urticae TaxID=32264 RepID=T1KX70_TETUR
MDNVRLFLQFFVWKNVSSGENGKIISQLHHVYNIIYKYITLVFISSNHIILRCPMISGLSQIYRWCFSFCMRRLEGVYGKIDIL